MGRIIAMWSGPRNISTAMMRAWENRPDTVVWDEPLYPCFLDRTKVPHPGRTKVLEAHAHERSFEQVRPRLTSVIPGQIIYQKHIAHHLLEDMDRTWMDDPLIEHGFLIRDPREVILSLHQRYPAMGLRDTGLPQQLEIFRRRLGQTPVPPPVLDAQTVLHNPRKALAALCDRLGLPFRLEMLSWPPGPRDSDGAWAPWWYDSVWSSTGFVRWTPRKGTVPDHLEEVLEQCRPLYDELKTYSIEV